MISSGWWEVRNPNGVNGWPPGSFSHHQGAGQIKEVGMDKVVGVEGGMGMLYERASLGQVVMVGADAAYVGDGVARLVGEVDGMVQGLNRVMGVMRDELREVRGAIGGLEEEVEVLVYRMREILGKWEKEVSDG